METIQIIEYRRTRDFSRKMNATFEFVRQNFKQLGKSILYISGPPILMASVLMASFFGDITNMASSIGNSSNFGSVNFWLQFILAMTFFMVSTVTTICTINNYMILYAEKRSNKVEVSEVWERVRRTFWMYMSTTILFTLLAAVVYVVSIVPAALLGQLSPVLAFFAIMGCIVFLVWLFISCSLIYAIRSFENLGFMESISRSFNLIRGKWWSTFGLIVILYLIVLFTSYFLMLGFGMATLAFSIHDTGTIDTAEQSKFIVIFTMVFFSVYYLIVTFLYALPTIGIAFQYFNLVERKEAKHLITEIESIGEKPAAPVTSSDEQY